MTQLLVVGLGGFLGAIARYGISSWVHTRFHGVFPGGTLAVNLLGCLAIGILWVLVEERRLVNEELQLLLGFGFLGSLTTFSTFGHETVALLRSEEVRLALFSVAANLLLGFGAVVLGRWLGKLLA